MELIYLAVYVMLAIVWAAVSAVVADAKGNSQIAALALGAGLGPLGLLIVAVSSSDQAELDRRQVRSGTMKPCYYCLAIIPRAADVCQRCSRQLPAYGPAGTP